MAALRYSGGWSEEEAVLTGIAGDDGNVGIQISKDLPEGLAAAEGRFGAQRRQPQEHFVKRRQIFPI